jgi:hypothetical protein
MLLERIKEIESKRYIPKDYILLNNNESDLLFYTNNGLNNYWSAICYTKKSFRKTWFYRFKDKEQMIKTINNTIASFKERKQQVEKNRQERFKPHSLKINDILYCSWGYDQTNIDFFKVKNLIGKNKIEVVKMTNEFVSSGCQSNYVRPGTETKKTSVHIVDGKYNSIRIYSFASASKWNGDALRETDALSGH